MLVASLDGFLYIYALNLEEGGDCTLIKQFQIAEMSLKTESSSITTHDEHENNDNDNNVYNKEGYLSRKQTFSQA